MKRLFLIPLLFISFYASAQVGESFPQMEGNSLTEKTISVPKATMGKFTLVGIAFSQKAEDDLKSWFQPIYESYVMESDPNALIPMMKPDVNVVFIPMFTGVKRGASKSATKKMREGIDKKLHPHVMVYSGSMSDYDDILGLEDKELPYFYVLDKEGKIIYATEGKYNNKKYNEIDELVNDM